MTTPPNIQTPAYKPTKPDSPLFTTDSDSNVYVTPYTTPCHFTLSTFLHVLKELTLHPERNSSLILRADPIPLDTQSQLQSTDLDLDGGPRAFILENDLEKVDEVRVRLMPKQPKRDGKLDQRVVFYRSKEKVEHDHPARVVDGQASSSSSNLRSRPDEEKEMELEKGLVVMIPMVKVVEDIPFFHPPVRNLVFYYEERPELPEDQLEEELARLSTKDTNRETESMGNQPAEEESNPLQGRISISYLPFPPTTLKTVTDNEAPVSTLPPISTPLPFEGIRRASLPRKRSPLAGPRAAPPAPTETSQKEDQKVTEARLDRTCLALLERVYKHGFGQMVGYKKRVNHDVCPACPSHHGSDAYP
jgi:tRNASer (uridine44-2'-O)-methyltransferase